MPYPSSIPRPLLMLLAIVCTLAGPASAQAQAHGKGQGHAAKVARDLDDAMQPTRAAKKAHWVREIDGVRHVQVVVVSNDSDAEMGNLRQAVVKLGGTVHASHPAVHALTVQLKASDVALLADRQNWRLLEALFYRWLRRRQSLAVSLR